MVSWRLSALTGCGPATPNIESVDLQGKIRRANKVQVPFMLESAKTELGEAEKAVPVGDWHV